MSSELFFENDGICRPIPSQFRGFFSAHGRVGELQRGRKKYPSLLAMPDASPIRRFS
jgi:hypothetical protein